MENNLDDLKNSREKIIKDLEEKIDKLNIEYNQKKFEYEKLERTSGVRSKVTWACIDIQQHLSNKLIEIGNIYNFSDESIRNELARSLKQLVIHLRKFADNLDDILANNDNKKIKLKVSFKAEALQ